nr:hypothetical protein TDPV-014 [Oriental turtle dovepox virus]
MCLKRVLGCFQVASKVTEGDSHKAFILSDILNLMCFTLIPILNIIRQYRQSRT